MLSNFLITTSYVYFCFTGKSGNFRVFGFISEEGYCKYNQLLKLLKKNENDPHFYCSLCNDIKHEDRHVVLDHLEAKHLKRSYECGECGILLPTRELTNAHKVKKHGKELIEILDRMKSKYCIDTKNEGNSMIQFIKSKEIFT